MSPWCGIYASHWERNLRPTLYQMARFRPHARREVLVFDAAVRVVGICCEREIMATVPLVWNMLKTRGQDEIGQSRTNRINSTSHEPIWSILSLILLSWINAKLESLDFHVRLISCWRGTGIAIGILYVSFARRCCCFVAMYNLLMDVYRLNAFMSFVN